MADQQNPSASPLWIVIVALVLVLAVALPFTHKGEKAAPPASMSEEDTAARIQPVARFEVKEAGAVSDKPRDGATVYQTVCSACHAVGAAGSPKTGDKAAWGPRIAQGKEALYKSALNGKNAMPARGGSADLSDAEVKAAVDHLVGLAK